MTYTRIKKETQTRMTQHADQEKAPQIPRSMALLHFTATDPNRPNRHLKQHS